MGRLLFSIAGPDEEKLRPAGADEAGRHHERFFDIATTGVLDDIPAAQGTKYLSMRGTDVTLDNFFVGLIELRNPDSIDYIPLPTTVPENLYFNCFLHSDGSPATIAVIEFVSDRNDNQRWDGGDTPFFKVEGDFPIDHNGWIH